MTDTQEPQARALSIPVFASAEAIATLRGDGLNDVICKRVNQIDVHGYGRAHDAEHSRIDLLNAADAYLEATRFQLADGRGAQQAAEEAEFLWPFANGFNVGTPRANLIKAAALLLAAIDRLDATAQDAPLVDGEPH